MGIGFWQIAVVVILVVLLFGRGKISSLMGDVAKGIKSFKKGMASDVIEDTSSNVTEDTSSNVTDDTSSNVTEDSKPKNIPESNQDPNNKE